MMVPIVLGESVLWFAPVFFFCVLILHVVNLSRGEFFEFRVVSRARVGGCYWIVSLLNVRNSEQYDTTWETDRMVFIE